MTSIIKTLILVLSTYVQYHPCNWSQTSNVGTAGGGVGTNTARGSKERGIFMFEMNVSADDNNAPTHVGS